MRESVDTAAGLAAAARRGHGRVSVARLQHAAGELALLASHCEGLPLVLLVPDPRALASRALQAGAGAVLELAPRAERLAAAVLSVGQGLVVVPAGAAGDTRLELTGTPEPLTPRELEILGLLAAGDSNKTIAARLSISVHTVKFHVSSIFSKLGVASRTEAVSLGLRLGIVLL
ncbi:MAG TPA: response regulator transcription factor [Steroidobacteraceae bacterium]|nr:response regulator transcription factor [Steroidobacteraceae bacterium]